MPDRAEAARQIAQAIADRLARNQRVRRRLPGGGRIHLDRPLPFLAVHRTPAEGGDSETRRLVVAEPAYLIASAEPERQAELAQLVESLATALRARFGAVLVVEVWSAGEGTESTRPPAEGTATGVRRPTFCVAAGTLSASDPTVQQLERALSDIPLRPPPLDVEVVTGAPAHPPELPPLLPAPAADEGLHQLGIEVQPIYRQAKTGIAYPELLRTARRGLAHALRQTFYHFAITHTSLRPEHYHELGRRTPLESVWRADRRLSEITASFDFLLQVTPVNAARAWAEFRRKGFSRAPEFDYRPLVVDVPAMKRKLFSIRTDRLEDPTLAHLLDDTRDELDRRITMLGDRNTPRFLHGSLQVYGGADDSLHALAGRILEELEPQEDENDETAVLEAAAFGLLAERELAYYRDLDPAFDGRAEVSGEVPGVMVSKGRLLIGASVSIAERRADALLQHEVGTHVLTHHNGVAQPLSQLASGLAGYEELQEGLAVFAEYLAGGLSPARLRTLAARVVAVRWLTEGADFVEAFRALCSDCGVRERTAFTLCMRVYRSGGLTKDVVYLRGLVRLLDYLHTGGELDALYFGKIGFAQIAMVQELRWRQVLSPPALLPRYLTSEPGAARLARARAGFHPLDLLETPR